METNDKKNPTTEYVDLEEYYDENADKKYEDKYKPKSLYDKYTKSKNFFVYVCLIFAVCLALLFGPFFRITEISITGNSKLSREEILKASNLIIGSNIIKADVNGASKNIALLPFVDTVSVKRESPSKISITIKECTQVAVVKYLGNYVTVSSEGKILEINPKKDGKKLPELLNVKLGKTDVGNQIVFADEKQKDVVKQYLKSLDSTNVLTNIKTIDFSNLNDIKFVLDNDILVKMGHADKISYKFAYLEKIYVELKGQSGGVLDLTNPDKSARYKASEN